MLHSGAALANTAWFCTSLPSWRRFQRFSSSPETTQRRLLARYLEQNAQTAFGQRYRFDRLRNWEAYAAAIEPRTYDEIAPWIDRIVAGESSVLTADRVRLLEPTSGSTGSRKLIPYNGGLQSEFQRAIAAWISQTILQDRSILGGRAYWSLSPAIDLDGPADCAVPIGFDDDSAYLGGVGQRIVRRAMAVPDTVARLREMREFRLATLALLLQASDLRLVSVWHPSFLLILLQCMRSDWDELLSIVRSGRTFGDVRVPAIPRRAAQLATFAASDTAKIWPDLALLSCWAHGHAGADANLLQQHFPHAQLQAKGLVATEAIASLPMSGKHPLAINSHFFEFEDANGNVLPSWQVQPDNTYALIVTTGGGLYRYRLGDLVRIVGFYNKTPCIEFVGKETSVSDYFGEKLSEPFVARVLRDACKQVHISPAFIMLAFDATRGRAGYRLYLQADGDVPGSLPEVVESGLRQNPHYALCVRLGQLSP
ncbi:MAG: GH3 auxin-responsive promoter family protein, partial [Gammaproteobacteria bacterium]|nr:GH3 auxin-responsive promoter family protein [Gammaproteobacteria bacterium]